MNKVKLTNESTVSNSFISTLPAEPTIEDSAFYVDSLTWKYLVRNIKRHKPTMLMGPTGTGKTELVLTACKKLGISCEVHDMGSMQDPLSDLLGTHRIKNGNSVFDYAKFVEDVQKPGVVLLDELSRAPLMTNNILFPCLDNRRELPLEIADSAGPRSVKIHPDCTFIATANIGTEYVGTNEIDEALMNRFLPLKVGYMPMQYEVSLLIKKCNINTKSAMLIVSLAQQIRDGYKQQNISKSMSTRECITLGEMVADGFSILDAVNMTLLSKFPEEDQIYIKEYMMDV